MPATTLVSSFLYSVRHRAFTPTAAASPGSWTSGSQGAEPSIRVDGSNCSISWPSSTVVSSCCRASCDDKGSSCVLDRYPDYHRVGYVDLIDDNLGSVDSYLGFPLHTPHRIEPVCGSSGRWVTATGRIGLPKMTSCRSDPCWTSTSLAGLGHDWSLADAPVILPVFASDYVRRIVQEKRDKDRGRWLRRSEDAAAESARVGSAVERAPGPAR